MDINLVFFKFLLSYNLLTYLNFSGYFCVLFKWPYKCYFLLIYSLWLFSYLLMVMTIFYHLKDLINGHD